MKKYIIFFLIIGSLLGCSKSSDVTPSTTTTTSYVSMKINGVLWKSSIGAGAITLGNFSGTGALDGTTGKEVLSMVMANCATVGTVYKFEEANDRLFQFSRQGLKVNYFITKDTKGSSGTLTITKTKVLGTLTYANATFAGTAVGSDGTKIVITEGQIVNAQAN
jgi:hypothetical protein